METKTVRLEFDAESKTEVRFREIEDGEICVGTIKISKDTLADMDWDGEDIEIEIKIAQ